MEISEGKPYPLGATADEKGANFAVFSANATKVEVCFFDTQGKREFYDAGSLFVVFLREQCGNGLLHLAAEFCAVAPHLQSSAIIWARSNPSPSHRLSRFPAEFSCLCSQTE